MPINKIKRLLKAIFEKDGRILFAYLFGSIVKGDVAHLSDIDVAVYLSGIDDDSLFDAKLSLHGEICRALKRNDVDLLVLNRAANKILLEDIIRTGMTIYDRDVDARVDFEVKVLHQAIDFKTHRRAVMGI